MADDDADWIKHNAYSVTSGHRQLINRTISDVVTAMLPYDGSRPEPPRKWSHERHEEMVNI